MLDAVGQYKILEKTGAGPLGETYRARDTRAGRTVTVVMVRDAIGGDPAERARFMAAASRAAQLSHPNIAAVYEVGDADGALFLAEEYVAGQSLATLIADHAMNARRAIGFATQMADAFAEAHAAAIPHGAIAPEHVIVTPKGNVKILHTGLTSWIDPAAGDEQADLWSLGLVLYHMITGGLPTPGWPAPAPSSVNRRLPKEIDPIVARLLATDAASRYQSAAAVAADLRSLAAKLDERTDESPPATSPATRAGRPRRGVAIWLLAALVIGIVVAAIVWAALRAM